MATSSVSPIFIAGLARSGTTLLRSMLGSHPRIAFPPSDLKWWTLFFPRYRRTDGAGHWDRLVDEIVAHGPTRALGLPADRVRFLADSAGRDPARLFALVLDEFAASRGKPRWGDKTPRLEIELDAVFEALPDARVIHLIRDPRDVCASTYHFRLYSPATNWLRHGTVWTSLNWRESVRLTGAHVRLRPEQNLVVRYEDLVRDPEGECRRICRFLGEEFAPTMIEMAGFPEFGRQGGNSSFGVLEGVSVASIGRFRQVLSPVHTRLCEILARGEMMRWGYEPSGLRLGAGGRLRLAVVDLPLAAAVASVRSGIRVARRLAPSLAGRRAPRRRHPTVVDRRLAAS